MKVALFAPSMGGGGAERMFKRLATGFAQAGLDVDLVLACAEGPNLEGLASGVNVVDLESPRLLRATRPLVRYLDRCRPDALLRRWCTPTWSRCGRGRRLAVDRGLFCREATTLGVSSANAHDRRDRWAGPLARRFYPAADAIVAVSEGVAADLTLNMAFRGRCVCHNNPSFDPGIVSLKREPADHSWFDDGGPPVVLAAGRLVAQKQFDVLISAIAMVRGRMPVRLLIMGEGEQKRIPGGTRRLAGTL